MSFRSFFLPGGEMTCTTSPKYAPLIKKRERAGVSPIEGTVPAMRRDKASLGKPGRRQTAFPHFPAPGSPLACQTMPAAAAPGGFRCKKSAAGSDEPAALLPFQERCFTLSPVSPWRSPGKSFPFALRPAQRPFPGQSPAESPARAFLLRAPVSRVSRPQRSRRLSFPGRRRSRRGLPRCAAADCTSRRAQSGRARRS
jgi:hypothetical protein